MSPFNSDFNNPWPEISLDSNDKGMAIAQYCRYLHLLYKAEGSDRLEKISVGEVRLYKARKSPQHEYISAKVCIAGSPSNSDSEPRYIFFERFKGGKDNLKPSFSPFFTRKSKSCPDDSDSPNSSAAYFANDKVNVGNRPYHHNQDEVHRILIFDPPLHLYQLALLAYAIHESSNMYTTLKANCYFYAGIFINVLRNHFTWGVLHVTGSEAVERANRQVVKQSSKDKAGTAWSGINLAGNSDETAGIIARYEETANNFLKGIEANEAIARAAKQEKFNQETRRAEEELKMALLASKLEAEQLVVRKAEEEAQAAFALRMSAQQAELQKAMEATQAAQAALSQVWALDTHELEMRKVDRASVVEEVPPPVLGRRARRALRNQRARETRGR